MDVTTEAKEKKDGPGGAMLESVFSAAIFSENFYRDLFKGHSAKAVSLFCIGKLSIFLNLISIDLIKL